MNNKLIKTIIDQLKDVEAADLWIDENFEKKISQVDADTAFIRPLPELHSVAELLSHLAVWRREVVSRLNGAERGLEMSDRENWKTNEELKIMGWEDLKQSFYLSQREVLDLLSDKDDGYLDLPYPHADLDFPYTNQYLLIGLIHHDMYHLGQIGITIKYLQRKLN